MIYFLGWILLVGISVWVSLLAFVWGLRTGQFSDQGRARYLPLVDTLPGTGQGHSKRKVELYVVLFAGGAGLLAIVISLFVSLHGMKG